LRSEIKKKCDEKLDEEWVKFGFYARKDEASHKLCMFANMVKAAKENLKIGEPRARFDYSSSTLVSEKR
jgi:hypothetical protein